MTTRRTILWAAPAVMVAVAAPSYAASDGTCEPLGCKHPGLVRAKAYRIAPACNDQAIVAAYIDGTLATQRPGDPLGWWVERDDSRRRLMVSVTYADGSHWSGAVEFPPHHEEAH